MRHKTRVSFLLGAVMALFLLTQSAHALSLPGFPPLTPTIKPVKMVQFCERILHVAGLTIKVPRICKDVPPPPPAVPQLTFTATPSAIVSGNSATLAWDSTDATSCTASGGWSGAKALDGNESVSPAATANYVLTCVNGANSVAKDVTVTVNPVPVAPTLTLVKTVTNNSGGGKVAADFQAKIDGVNVPWGVAQTMTVGAHTASEVEVAGYTASVWGADCAANGTITLADGENKTCTITNDDVAPAPTTGTLIVDKVTEPSGDTTDFSITASGSGAITGGESGMVTDALNKSYEVAPGMYSVSEVAPAGWTIVSNTCVNVVVAAGETKNCTITNAKLPKLTVTKIVMNEGGGAKQVADFPLFIDGVSVTSGAEQTVALGAHTVSETGDANYTAVIGGHCATNGTITLLPGDVKSCTITNTFVPPVPQGKLLITEFLYDTTTGQGTEPGNEWVELYNGTSGDIDLSGYYIHDSAGSDLLPSVVLPAGKFAFITGSSTTAGLWPSMPVGTVILMISNASIGSNGLTNGGDVVWLENTASTTVDAVSWGTDTTAFSPSVTPVASAGHSLARSGLTTDTDTAADWIDVTIPAPGQ